MANLFRASIVMVALLSVSLADAAGDELVGEGRYIGLNGVNIYYEIHGTGEPLLLLHGGLSHSGAWHNQIADLAPHFQLILMDSRGHGRSSFNDEQISYAAMANDVIELLNVLKIERTHLLGWSDGGIIGLELAIRVPDRLGKLVAFGANYHPSGVREDAAENKRFGQFFAQSAREYQSFSPAPERWQSFLDNIMKMWASEPNFSVSALAGISSEILILAGAQEEAIKISHVESMAKLIPQSSLRLMPDTGHFALWEKPDKFNRIVLEFLKPGINPVSESLE